MNERERRLLAFMVTGFPRIVISLLLIALVVLVLWVAGVWRG